jgi:hypothetical protein
MAKRCEVGEAMRSGVGAADRAVLGVAEFVSFSGKMPKHAWNLVVLFLLPVIVIEQIGRTGPGGSSG